MTAGRPPTRALQILELWISIIDRFSDLNVDSGVTINNLRDRLQNSTQYVQDREKYESTLVRLPVLLSTGIEHDLFECIDDVFWKLSRKVISIIKSKRFKEERKDGFEEAVRTIWESIRDNKWQDYYKPKPVSTTDIPKHLKSIIFQISSSEKNPMWINPQGVNKEEINAGYIPIKTLKSLKIYIEEQWSRNKIPILSSDPAQGKTTSVSVLAHWLGTEQINNIIFKLEAHEWEDYRIDFTRYIQEISPFDNLIIIIENIHLASNLHKLEEFNKRTNVNFILTSRRYETRLEFYRNSEEFIILPLPASYSKELLRLFIGQYGIKLSKNKKLLHGLLRDNSNQNILFLLTHTIEKLDKKEIFVWDRFIQELEERLFIKDGSDRNFWRWILYSLSVMRRYELEISQKTLYNFIKIYDETLTRNYLGRTITNLEEQGIIIMSRFESQNYKLVFHPYVAEQIEEYYSNIVIQFMDNSHCIQDHLLEIWLETGERSLFDIETLIHKIGFEKYNSLDLSINFWKQKNFFRKNGEQCFTSFNQKTQFFALNFHQKNLKNIIHDIFDCAYFEQFLLYGSLDFELPSVISLEEREIIKKHIHDNIDIRQVELDKFFANYVPKDDFESFDENGYGHIQSEYGDYRSFYYLSKNHPDFEESIHNHLKNLFEKGKYITHLRTIFRVPRFTLRRLDFQYVSKDISFFEKIFFEVNQHYTGLEEDIFIITTYELLEIWNGPKLEEIASLLLEHVKECIISNTNFIENEREYFLKSRIETHIDNAEIEQELNRYNFIDRFSLTDFNKKNPEWILRRLIFLRHYNNRLYNHIIRTEEVKDNLKLIAKDNHKQLIFTELGIRPSIFELERHELTIQDIQHMKISNIKQKITANPLNDWLDFLQSLQRILDQMSSQEGNLSNTLAQQIESLNAFVKLKRSKISKVEYIEAIERKIVVSPSYSNKATNDIVESFFEIYKLDSSEVYDLGNKYNTKFCTEYTPNNSVWELGYLSFEPSQKQLFLKKFLNDQFGVYFLKNIIFGKEDREILTETIIELVTISDEFDISKIFNTEKNIRILVESFEISKIDFLLNNLITGKLGNCQIQFIYLKQITSILRVKDKIHNFIAKYRRLNSTYLHTLYTKLTKHDKYKLLEFLLREWPVHLIFNKVCNLIGATELAEILGLSLGLIKSETDNSFPTTYSKTNAFLIENEMAPEILYQLLMRISFRDLNNGEENRIIVSIFNLIIKSNNISLNEEFPIILSRVVESKETSILEIINPKSFSYLSPFQFESIIKLISNFQLFKQTVRDEIKNLIIYWNSSKSTYNQLKTREFIQFINSIWKWHDFNEETKNWDRSTREILFNMFIKDLLDLRSHTSQIQELERTKERQIEYNEILEKFNDIFTVSERIDFLKQKLDEILLDEDLKLLNTYMSLIKVDFSGILKQILEDQVLEDWMFYYTLRIQENEYNQELDFEHLPDLVSILRQIQDHLPFSFDSWLESIFKQAPNEFITLFTEQHSKSISEELLKSIIKIKEVRNWKPKEKFLLMITIIKIGKFTEFWSELAFLKNTKPISITDLNYFLALLILQKIINKNEAICKELDAWKESIKDSIYPLIYDFEYNYKIILETILELDLNSNIVDNKSDFLHVLRFPEEIIYFEDDPFSGFKEIIKSALNSSCIWNFYWKKKNKDCLMFLQKINFEGLIELLAIDDLFGVFMENKEIQQIILMKLTLENYEKYIGELKRFQTIRNYFPILKIFNRILESSIKNEFIESIRINNFKFIRNVIVNYFSYDISIVLEILNKIKTFNQDIESLFIKDFEKKDNYYGFNDMLARSMIRRSVTTETSIKDLEYTKKYLTHLFNHIISTTDYHMVWSYLRDSSSPRNYEEVIWYLGSHDSWKANARKLARDIVKGGSYYRDFEMPFVITHLPDFIDDTIRTEIKKKVIGIKNDTKKKMQFALKMENIILTWAKSNL